MGMKIFSTGFQWTMVEDHFVKIAKGEEEGGGGTLAAKLLLRVTKMICPPPFRAVLLGTTFHNISSSFQDGIQK